METNSSILVKNKMRYLLLILLLVFGCNVFDSDQIEAPPIPEMDEICENQYSTIDGSVITCDFDCEYIEGDCYHVYDLYILDLIRDANSILTLAFSEYDDIIDMGTQEWTNGRLTYLDIDNYYYSYGFVDLNYIPGGICNLDCYVDLDGHNLCDSYQFDCIDNIGYQDITGCEGYSAYSGGLYYDSDIDALSEIKSANESFSDVVVLDMGSQVWTNGRLTFLSLYELGVDTIPPSISNLVKLGALNLRYNQLSSIPETLCDLSDCYITVTDNMLCEEYKYDCLSNYDEQWSPQSQSNCCEGVNDEGETVPNWTQCEE